MVIDFLFTDIWYGLIFGGFTDFFQNIKVGGGKKIKITKKLILFNLKHNLDRSKKITKIV